MGHNFFGSIISSYSRGWVSGDFLVGGLVGYNDEYTGTITSSFWDTDTSGQMMSAGGIGLPKAQMLDITKHLNAGWDFMDETENGTENIWWMPIVDYPRLWWEQLP